MDGFNVSGLIYTCIYLISFLIIYFIILYSNIEKLFKQGAIWPIRLAQLILAFILAYFVAQGVQSLINAAQSK